MEGIYWLLGLILAIAVALFFLMEQRWKKIFEEVKKDQSSQPMWALMQQQMEQLRGQMSNGLNKNISLARNRFDEARGHLEKFSLKLEQIESQPSLPSNEKQIEVKNEGVP
jgi:hypothetical protein